MGRSGADPERLGGFVRITFVCLFVLYVGGYLCATYTCGGKLTGVIFSYKGPENPIWGIRLGGKGFYLLTHLILNRISPAFLYACARKLNSGPPVIWVTLLTKPACKLRLPGYL